MRACVRACVRACFVSVLGVRCASAQHPMSAPLSGSPWTPPPPPYPLPRPPTHPLTHPPTHPPTHEHRPPLQSGALAYGFKLDERVKVTPNAKLRASLARLTTKAGQSLDTGTAAAAELKLKPGGDDAARLLLGGMAIWQRRDVTYQVGGRGAMRAGGCVSRGVEPRADDAVDGRLEVRLCGSPPWAAAGQQG